MDVPILKYKGVRAQRTRKAKFPENKTTTFYMKPQKNDIKLKHRQDRSSLVEGMNFFQCENIRKLLIAYII